MKLNFRKRKKGFTLIELVVVIAIMAILALIIVPNLTAYTQKGELSKHTNNVRLIENSINLHVMDYGDFPRLTDDAYTKAQIEAYSQGIFDSTGKKVTLDPDGNYYDIDYEKLKEYVSIPAPVDRPKYILQNPVGKVFYLHDITVEGDKRADFSIKGEESGEVIVPPVEPESTGIYTKEQIEALKVQGYIEVKTAEELNSIRNKLSGKYIQTQDIDLSTITNFEPIGNNSSTPFTGTYDGGGFTVSGLTINKPGVNYIGLFGSTSGATIKNVGLVDVDIKGRSYVGGLVGYSYESSTVINSYATGAVSGSGSNIGGLVGVNIKSAVTNSYATGSVSGASQVGGLVGYNYNSSTVSNSYATGAVTGSSQVGGLVGYNQSSTVSNSYWDKNTTSQPTSAGGTGLITAQMKLQTSYTGWDFNNTWQINSNQYPTLR